MVRFLAPSSLARFDGDGGSFAFPFPLSTGLVATVPPSSSRIGSSATSLSIALKLISDPSKSARLPLFVMIVFVLVELSARCRALPFLAFRTLLTLTLSSSIPLVPPAPPPSCCIFRLRSAWALPFEFGVREELDDGLRERENEEAEVPSELDEGPTKS